MSDFFKGLIIGVLSGNPIGKIDASARLECDERELHLLLDLRGARHP